MGRRPPAGDRAGALGAGVGAGKAEACLSCRPLQTSPAVVDFIKRSFINGTGKPRTNRFKMAQKVAWTRLHQCLFSPPYSKLTYSTPYEQLVCFYSLQLKAVVSSYEKEVIVSTRSAKPTDCEHKECKRQMLENSIFELRSTVTELEKSLNSTENEDNEWKTRYETQVEWNKQLERQINILRDKVELIHGNPADKRSLVHTFDKMPVGSLKEVLKQLEEEKKILQNQLQDYELRLKQEAKAYHKVNDERRLYLSEILQTSAKPKIAEKKKTDALTGKREKQILRGRQSVPGNPKMVNPQK